MLNEYQRFEGSFGSVALTTRAVFDRSERAFRFNGGIAIKGWFLRPYLPFLGNLGSNFIAPSLAVTAPSNFVNSGVESRNARNEAGGQWLRPSEIGTEGTGCNRPLRQADTCSEPYPIGSKPVISQIRSSALTVHKNLNAHSRERAVLVPNPRSTAKMQSRVKASQLGIPFLDRRNPGPAAAIYLGRSSRSVGGTANNAICKVG